MLRKLKKNHKPLVCTELHMYMQLPYSWKLSWDKLFTNAVKVATFFMWSLTQEKKFVEKKFCQWEQVAKLVKISSCKVLHITIELVHKLYRDLVH